jgi:hypothetical protein
MLRRSPEMLTAILEQSLDHSSGLQVPSIVSAREISPDQNKKTDQASDFIKNFDRSLIHWSGLSNDSNFNGFSLSLRLNAYVRDIQVSNDKILMKQPFSSFFSKLSFFNFDFFQSLEFWADIMHHRLCVGEK